jgi:hypothetical protein
VRPKILSMIGCAVVVIWAAGAAKAQDRSSTSGQPSGMADIVQQSRQHMKKAEECFSLGDLECARREFDIATDVVVDSGVDVRSDTALKLYWRQLVEKIDRYQLAAANGSPAVAWKTQEYDGRPPEDPPASGVPNFVRDSGPLSLEAFHQRFAELQARFRVRFGRDMVITGADHEEHRRLYGAGSAYDVRVKDLSSEEIKFIIDTGRAFGLRVKDFSTWDKVQAHNSRVFSMGLQSDTLATAVHLHIDRNPDGARIKYIADPASARQH